ncbi:MAG TPA: isoaspartyl peptidase/L-asparaginase [Thermoanaerobaculia bacterium]|nr:isoaspartyl peptidase/L-asparaginase [Thermoanaerobaculia bacterium]
MNHLRALFPFRALAALSLLLLFAAAAPAQQDPNRADITLKTAQAPPATQTVPRWSLAIHGGAGTIPKTLPAAEKQAYLDSLSAALKIGRDVLAGGGTSLDAVEKVVRFLEDDPRFNAGKGAVFTHDGKHELDAAIMDGRDLSCGAIAGARTVKNPISLARLVMTKTPHVFLVGEGVEKFAEDMKVERVSQDYFFVQRRYDQWQEALKKEKEEKDRDTVGAVALDVHGNLAAATSTGGMTNKRWGRVGDVPVIGAGTYANNRTAAISATGVGEQFIRNAVAHDISALVEYRGMSVQQAAEEVVHRKLKKDDGGVIAVGRDGSIALVFNSEGMYRGAADSKGRFEVAIWE